MIYFVECADRVKIGFSNSPQKRFRVLATGMPFPARLVGVTYGDEAEEKRLHQEFASERVVGEWFADNPRLRDLIDKVAIRSVDVGESDFLEYIQVPKAHQAPIVSLRHPLAAWRKTEKLSQEAFAGRIGVSRWMVNSIETGKRKPSFDVALKIQNLTEITPSELVAERESA
jgi:DNA-binding XRE family transcriptional regulator